MTRITCPSCGGALTLHNPGICTIVCAYCQTTVVWRDGVALAGQRSIVEEPRSAVAVGASGTVAGRTTLVLGRVQFAWEGGRWDEWYVEQDDGSLRWLVEDERNYSLEEQVEGVRGPATFALGASATHEGTTFEIDEVRRARCVGVEGQIPRGVSPGAEYDYADLSEPSGREVLALEREPDGGVIAFRGQTVPASAVDFGPVREDFAGGGLRPGSAVQCPACGAGFTLRPQERVESATCTSCGRQLGLSDAGLVVLGRNARAATYPFAVGDAGTLHGARWEIVGRLLHEEGFGELTREYLLWSPRAGYRWLEEYDEHYILLEQVQAGPPLAFLRTAFPRSRIDVLGTSFVCFERGDSKLVHVDGALPYRATVGERSSFVDFVAPPRVYSVSMSDEEVERYLGEHVDGAELFAAFGKAEEFVAPHGVGPATPPAVGPGWRRAATVALVFAVINAVLALATLGTGKEIVAARVAGADLAGEGWLSPTFVIPEGTRVLGLELGADLNNSWVAVDAELVDARNQETVGATFAEMAYYQGVEGGESWSEGNRSKTQHFAAPTGGEYVLRLVAEGEQPTDVVVRVTAGARLTRYPLGLAILCGLLPFGLLLLHQSHEQRRWGDEGDDDD